MREMRDSGVSRPGILKPLILPLLIVIGGVRKENAG
jgi:hypothetical protein